MLQKKDSKGIKMAGSVNKVIILGNLGVDPEVRSFPNGGKVCNLRIATSENWKDKNTGERREKTDLGNHPGFSSATDRERGAGGGRTL